MGNKTHIRLLAIVIMAVLIASSGQPCSASNLVVNSGFETTETTGGGLPTTYGDWNGDYSSIVSATSGITPLEGSKMLKFMGTSFYGNASSVACEVVQLIDVSQYAGLIDSGNAVANASVYFNRVAGDAQTDTRFSMYIAAHQGSTSSYETQKDTEAWLLCVSNSIISDNNPATWERLDVQMTIPTNTDYLAIEVYADENIYNDLSGTEFDGHFADQVSLQITPEPATLLLLGLGAVMLRRKK